MKCGAMRSFVTLSGTCSLDLGIQAKARHPMAMIRECYPTLKPEESSPIESIWNDYLSVTKRRNDDEIKKFILSQMVESLETNNRTNKLLNERSRKESLILLGTRDFSLENFKVSDSSLYLTYERHFLVLALEIRRTLQAMIIPMQTLWSQLSSKRSDEIWFTQHKVVFSGHHQSLTRSSTSLATRSWI
jgi:hypothetical protein